MERIDSSPGFIAPKVIDAEDFLANARKAFRLAADATDAKSLERYAGMGLDYLQLAQDAATLAGAPKPPRWGSLP